MDPTDDAAEPIESAETTTEVPPALPDDWLKQCQVLRNEDRLDEALLLSKLASPQLQALEQQTLIFRAKIRDARQQQDETAMREWLDALYLVAARASLLHDAPPAQHPEAPRRLFDSMDRADYEELPMPYTEIGHQRLKLLRKTDRQLLESLYGKAHRHVTAREWHRL